MTLEKCIAVLDKALEYSLYGLAFFIPIGIAWVEIFSITAISSFVLKNILAKILDAKRGSPARTSSVSFFTTTNILLLLFFLFCGLSLIHSSPYLSKGLNALFGKWGKFIMLFWAASATLGSGNRLRNITLVLMASAGIVALDAFSQKFLGSEFLLHRKMLDVNYAGHTIFAVTGAFKHPNDFASYLIAAIPLLAGMVAAFRPSASPAKPIREACFRAGLLTVTLLLMFCLILTFSRAGWLAFLVAGTLMFLLLPRKKFFLVLGAVFIILIFALPGVSERAVTTLHSGGDSGRFQLWKGTWAMIQEHPFLGKGVGTYMDFFQDYVKGRGAMYAHNCYLQMGAEVGAFGLFSFLMFIGSVLSGGLKTFRQSPWGESAGVLAGLLCGVIAFLVQSGLDTNLYSLQPSAVFWLFLAMIQAGMRKKYMELST